MLNYMVIVVFVLNFVPLAGCLSVLPCPGEVFPSGLLCRWPQWSFFCVWKWRWPGRRLWAESFALVMLLAEASCHCYLLLLRSCFYLLRCPLVWLVEMLCHVLMDAG